MGAVIAFLQCCVCTDYIVFYTRSVRRIHTTEIYIRLGVLTDLTNPYLLRSFQRSNVLVDFVGFLFIELAACSKPPSRDNYRTASYPRTQQRDQGAVKPKSCDQGRRKNNAFTLTAVIDLYNCKFIK